MIRLNAGLSSLGGLAAATGVVWPMQQKLQCLLFVVDHHFIDSLAFRVGTFACERHNFSIAGDYARTGDDHLASLLFSELRCESVDSFN